MTRRRFIKKYTYFFNHPTLSSLDGDVYGFLEGELTYRGRQHMSIPNQFIADELGLSLTTVKESLARLKQAGLLITEHDGHAWRTISVVDTPVTAPPDTF